ncbi:MAG: Fluoroacetyl-CoA thioesterase [Bacteroidetes bacterium ADurb.Bin408]|nr:MAG: Fluoroacetyl-CoA thioesterase [Bacteroidetes bacterium ADurb.Bin408]
MKKQLTTGIRGELSIIVTEKDTAARYGSGLIEVFATPAMIGLMEATAQQSVMSHLPPGSITLGTEVNIKHLKATPIGKKVICYSELKVVDGRRLEFSVQAFDEEGEIGCGTHTRFIVDKEKFINKLNTGK